MQIIISDSLALLDGLNKLDGCKFGTNGGKLRYNVAKDIRLLNGARDDIAAAQKAVMNELSGGKGFLQQGTSAAFKFQESTEDMLRQKIELPLLRLPFADLKVDDNNIDGSTLAKLHPILDYPQELTAGAD